MRIVKKRYIILFTVIIIISLIIIIASSVRLYPTHTIVKQVNCFSCHIDEFNDLKEGKHIRMMNATQNRALYDYLDLYGNVSDTYKSLEGPCYTCHITYKNFYFFGLTDPYAYSIGNKTYQINNLTKELDTVNAQYGYIIEWPAGKNYSTVLFDNTSNASIHVELEVLDVSPTNFSIDSTIKILMANYSGKQYNTSYDYTYTLLKGETQIIDVTNIYEDYFKVILILDGLWNNTLVNLRVNGTDKGTESFFIIANKPPVYPFVYELPFSSTGVYYFRTNGTYKAVRLDYIWAEWKNYMMENITSSEIIETNTTNGWINASTCSSPNAMCHINQKTTYMGLSNGLSPDKKLYTHTMDFTTSIQCTLCHFG